MATKTFSHAVIWNGKLVPANTPIEVKEVAEKSTATEKAVTHDTKPSRKPKSRNTD